MLKWSLPLVLVLIAVWITSKRDGAFESKDDDFTQTNYRMGSSDDLISDSSHPDTTAVILNWSRFPNVLRITSLLCSPILDGIISEVFVWNNSPHKISYDDFRDTRCRQDKLKIFNSPENLYFQARFFACAQSSTEYCFIQDDDYLILPEVIHTLHAQIRQSQGPHTIHLLPAHEHLTSTLRRIHVVNRASAGRSIHAGFAWLGHGSIMHRAEVTNFLALMTALNASESEMKMADNYFAILKNSAPEIWFDQGIELAGGRPFTVGVEGDERNNRHIMRAAEYLDSIIWGGLSPAEKLPFVRTDNVDIRDVTSVVRAVCRDARCLLESNISLLPETAEGACERATEMLVIESRERNRIAASTQSYLEHSPSMAVDNRPETYFESRQGATTGDFIQMDYFEDLRELCPSCRTLEIVWMIDQSTERILRSSILKSSADGLTWCVHDNEPFCTGSEDDPHHLSQCVFSLESKYGFAESGASSCRARNMIRLEVVRPVIPPVTWRVHEIWVQSLRYTTHSA